jgi:hypothetical protein
MNGVGVAVSLGLGLGLGLALAACAGQGSQALVAVGDESAAANEAGGSAEAAAAPTSDATSAGAQDGAASGSGSGSVSGSGARDASSDYRASCNACDGGRTCAPGYGGAYCVAPCPGQPCPPSGPPVPYCDAYGGVHCMMQ